MKKKQDRIYLNQWLVLKPYNTQGTTDSYYLKLCNEVKWSIVDDINLFASQIYLNNDDINALSCFLTSYFEDLISGTNIWNSFVKVNKRLYGNHLPFYETDEYVEQEINFEDICFLIWYFMNTIQDEKFITPFNDFIIKTSIKVMDIFEDAWEYAPENEQLKTFYSIPEEETDFYEARNLIDHVLFKSYLFYYDSGSDLRGSEFEIIEKSKNKENILPFLQENRDHKIHHTYTRLLGLKGQEWVAEILGANHPLSKHFSDISKKISGYFFYKGQDKENIFLEHIASGKKFNLSKKSFDRAASLRDLGMILYIGIVKWRNEWWFSGVYFQAEFDDNLVLQEKKSIKSINSVDFLDHQSNDMEMILGEQLKVFKQFNNNQQIAFMASDKIDLFIKNYIQYFNKLNKISKKDKEIPKRFFGEEVNFGDEQEPSFPSEASESGLVFFNPKSGIEIAIGVNSAFPMKNNSFFREEDSEEHIMQLFFAEELSAELAMFCIDNFKEQLDFFKTADGKLFLDNIDFLLRFWKRGNYFAKPEMTVIKKE